MNLRKLTGDQVFDPVLYGNKAKGLHSLLQKGIRIPETYLLPINSEITLQDIELLFAKNKTVIVRSSSHIEDSSSGSYAGVFLSLHATKNTIISAIEEVRLHAVKIFGQEIGKIALVIQPLILGIGGVFLYEKESRKESLIVSLLGASSITSGRSSEYDLLKPSSKEYLYALNECRKVMALFPISLDLEFAFQKTEIVFLQLRQLTGSIRNIGDDVLTRNEYFPYPMPSLCGTIWQNTLTNLIGTPFVYSGGFVKAKTESQDPPNVIIDDSKLEKAYTFYTEELFPRWRNSIDALKKETKRDPSEKFLSVFDVWCEFMREYLDNEFEYVVDYARKMSPLGTSLTPNVCEWLNRLNELTGINITEISIHPLFKSFISTYGRSFLPNSNYFNNPSIIENPEYLIEILRNTKVDKITYAPQKNPSLILKTAWLSEDDNIFKNEFSFYLRMSILDLANLWQSQRKISRPADIWDIEIDELIAAIREERAPKILSPKYSSKHHLANDDKVFGAEVLSAGNCSGKAFRHANDADEDKIFVKGHLDAWDYPTLLKSKAAVVAFGSVNAHFAIFARDLNKPVFKSFNAVKKIVAGERIELNSQTKTISIIS